MKHQCMNWKESKLGDVIIGNPEYGINAAAESFDFNKFTYLRITDIDDQGKLLQKTLCSISHPQSNNYLLNTGDIVFARTGASVGKTYIYQNPKQPLVYAGFLIRVKPNLDLVVPYFLFLQTQTKKYKNWIITNSMRSGQPGINSNELKTLPIIIPSLSEQKKIAQALTDADNYISALEKLIEKKKLMLNGLISNLLKPKKHWINTSIGEICSVIGGGTPSTAISKFWSGDIPWLTPTEMGKSKYIHDSERKISNLGLKNSSAKLLPINTLLLTSRATIGDVAILKIPATTNQGFQSLVCNKNIDPEFIYYLLLTKKYELIKNANGSTFLEITPLKIKEIHLSVPSTIEEQLSISRQLKISDEDILTSEKKLQKAYQIKQGMIQKLLTGEIRLA